MKFILAIMAAAAMSFSYGYSVQPDRPEPFSKPTFIEHHVNACQPLPNKGKMPIYDKLAAALPASALGAK